MKIWADKLGKLRGVTNLERHLHATITIHNKSYDMRLDAAIDIRDQLRKHNIPCDIRSHNGAIIDSKNYGARKEESKTR